MITTSVLKVHGGCSGITIPFSQKLVFEQTVKHYKSLPGICFFLLISDKLSNTVQASFNEMLTIQNTGCVCVVVMFFSPVFVHCFSTTTLKQTISCLTNLYMNRKYANTLSDDQQQKSISDL